MPGAVGFSIVLFAIAALVLLHGRGDILGLAPAEFAQVAALAAVALMLTGWAVEQFRGRWLAGLQALVIWAVALVGLSGVYSYRTELHEVAVRVIGDMAPGQPVTGSGGEVSVARRLDGSFVVAARANGRDLRFIFDTGASMVVLTGESAKAMGFTPADLNFVVPVLTANGRTLAAPVVLDQLSIGGITERRVRALVAREGVLHENLLGMTFLERLASYEVRDNRLFLRARGAKA